jgi:hypothetical protein
MRRVRALQVWKYGRTTGIWRPERAVHEETDAKLWLRIFEKDEPNEYFTLSRNEPKGHPKDEGTRGRK